MCMESSCGGRITIKREEAPFEELKRHLKIINEIRPYGGFKLRPEELSLVLEALEKAGRVEKALSHLETLPNFHDRKYYDYKFRKADYIADLKEWEEELRRILSEESPH